ncbi:MAG: TonB-dependent receptor [Bacteroidales bacterium]|nr:TonB-dependent receptor [Bacteroidales bacterium]
MRIVKRIKRMIFSKVALFALALGMGQSAFAQSQITAAGVIVDASKEPLIGVNVVVQGTNNGTITDFDGNFELTCPAGSKLEISYIGYKTQVLTASPSMKVTLQEDVTELATVEVVGVGYGTMRKSDLTGAIESVSAGDMKQGVVTSSEQLLQGKIAGLSVVQGSGDPAAGAVMRLRGGSSLSGNNAPLVVVDGVADVDMNTVQSSDIVSIDVLKDASASAIYGSRGANGVIIITTNRANKNNVSAQYNGYVGVATPTSQGKLDLLDAKQWREQKPMEEDLGADTDWQDEIMHNAVSQSHALTFNASNDKSGVKGSVSYLNSQGIVRTSELKRLGASLTGWTTLVDDRLRFEVGLNKNKDDYTDFMGDGAAIKYKTVFQSAYTANPTQPVYDENGNFSEFPGRSSGEQTNPLSLLEDNDSHVTKERFMGYFKTDLDIIKNELKATLNLSYKSTSNHDRFYTPSYSQATQSMNNGLAIRNYGNNDEKQLEFYLNYDKTFNSTHKLNVMAGYSYSKAGYEGFGLGASQFVLDDFGYNCIDASAKTNYIWSSKTDNTLVSFFGRVNYSYAGKYMLTATVRGDGSSKFGANNKWGCFPSGSLAWRITDEQFMQNSSNWLDNLKLRAGYGITGNQGGISPYTSLVTYKPKGNGVVEVNDEGREVAQLELTRAYNPDLRWETTGQFNVGLDFSLFNKLSGTIEYYDKRTWDLLYYYKIETTCSLIPYQLLNVGNMKNNGIEVTLNYNIFNKENFSWDVNFNIAHNHNEVTKLTSDRFKSADFNSGTLQDLPSSGTIYTQKLKEGYSIGSFFGAKTAGFDEEGKLLYVCKDGTTTADPLQKDADGNYVVNSDEYLGNAMPKVTMGIGFNFNFCKHWDASINGNGMFGQKVYNATAQQLSYYSAAQTHLNTLSDAMGKETDLKVASDYWLEKASFFRIQSVTLGYTIDLKKLKMNSLRIYATVDNLFVFTNYSGADPEVSLDMNVTELDEAKKRFPGIDNYNNFPKARTYMIGVNLKF